MTELLANVRGSKSVRRLEISLSISAPITKVWQSITNPLELENWWTGGEIEAREGGKIILEDGSAVNGTVKLCFEPYLFAFTWNDTPDNAAHPQLIDSSTKSTILFELVEDGAEQTRLKFSQYLPAAEIVGAAAGWHQILGERLKSYLETGTAPEHEERFTELQNLYKEAGIK